MQTVIYEKYIPPQWTDAESKPDYELTLTATGFKYEIDWLRNAIDKAMNHPARSSEPSRHTEHTPSRALEFSDHETSLKSK